MEKAKTVVDFYVLCNKLKNVIRTGWKDWNVKRERIESVAEHIFGTQMLALSMWSEYEYNLNIQKVLTMLAIHELEETVIGDLTLFQIDKKEKEEMGHKAVEQILKGLLQGEEIKKLIFEFDKQETAEAKFAYQCDKLECDIQSKIYDEENCVNLQEQANNPTAQTDIVSNLLNSGLSWGEMWITFGQCKYPYDKNFLDVSNYALKNTITNHINNH